MTSNQTRGHASQRSILADVFQGIQRDPGITIDAPAQDITETRLNVIIKDPHHCVTGNHSHADSMSVCLSVVCVFMGSVPQGSYRGQFAHRPRTEGTPPDDDEWDGYIEVNIEKMPQMCLFVGMSSLMVLAKPIGEKAENYPYLLEMGCFPCKNRTLQQTRRREGP